MATSDYSKRTHSTQKNSAVTSGYAVDFIHLSGAAQTNTAIPVRSVLTRLSINVAPGSGSVVVKIGGDVVLVAAVARDYTISCYAYQPVTIVVPDSTADVTMYFAPPPKGAVF